MSKAEEIKQKNKILFTQLRNGSETAEDELVKLNAPLISFCISKNCDLNSLKELGFSYDDVFSAGKTGLLKAIRAYDIHRDEFSTFANICISNAIMDLYKVKSVKHTKSFEELMKRKRLNRALVVYPTFHEDIEDESVIATLKQIIKYKLSERQGEIIHGYYFLEKTQTQLAKEFNVSQGRISSLLNESILKIKQVYGQLESGEISIKDLQKPCDNERAKCNGSVGPFMKKMLSSAENIKRLNELIDSTLTEHQAKIIRMRYLSTPIRRQKSVAQELGVRSISRCDAVSVDRLKQAYKEKYGESSVELEHSHCKMARVMVDPLLQKLMQDEKGMALLKQTSQALLTPRQLSVIEGRYFTMPPKTRVQLAKELNMTRQMVAYEEKRSVIVLKRKLTEIEN